MTKYTDNTAAFAGEFDDFPRNIGDLPASQVMVSPDVTPFANIGIEIKTIGIDNISTPPTFTVYTSNSGKPVGDPLGAVTVDALGDSSSIIDLSSFSFSHVVLVFTKGSATVGQIHSILITAKR